MPASVWDMRQQERNGRAAQEHACPRRPPSETAASHVLHEREALGRFYNHPTVNRQDYLHPGVSVFQLPDL